LSCAGCGWCFANGEGGRVAGGWFTAGAGGSHGLLQAGAVYTNMLIVSRDEPVGLNLLEPLQASLLTRTIAHM
jgi:hypothetical protein